MRISVTTVIERIKGAIVADEPSDFGSGYATCIRQFLFHETRLATTLASYASLHEDHPDLFSPTSAVQIWANGSSDHLYDLRIPSRLPGPEAERAKRLQSLALNIGHGFGWASSNTTPDEARALLAEARDLLAALDERGHDTSTLEGALEADRRMGLRPQRGQWFCEGDITE